MENTVLTSIRYIIMLLLAGTLAQAAELLQFTASVMPDNTVHLVWSVSSESGIVGFELERSTDESWYQPIGDRISCDLSSIYDYYDHPGLDAINRGNRIDVEQEYWYMLYYVLPTGERVPASEDPVQVSLTMNAVRVTWGGIKAMFR